MRSALNHPPSLVLPVFRMFFQVTYSLSSFLTDSYENCRGVGGLFPNRNASICGKDPNGSRQGDVFENGAMAGHNDGDRTRPSQTSRLAADAEFGDFGLVAFLLDGFLRDGAQGLFIRVFRRLAMAANHFFSGHDPYEPVGFRCIPGNFHSVGTHSFPPCQFGGDSTPWKRGGEPSGAPEMGCTLRDSSGRGKPRPCKTGAGNPLGERQQSKMAR